MEIQGKCLHDRGAVDGSSSSSSRPGSSMSIRSTGNDGLSILEQLRSRLDAAEYENERLRVASDTEGGLTSSLQLEQLERLQKERQDALERTLQLEERLPVLEGRLATSIFDLDNLRTSHQNLTLQLEEKNAEAHRLTTTYRSDLQSHTREAQGLKERIDELDRLSRQKDENNQTQISTIKELENNLEKLLAEMDDERQDLNTQIDELRVAGQVR
jgi:chromosome segregation ATPase